MRDLIIFTIVFGLLPLCLFRPYVGILLWSWLGYMNPHKLAWGFAYEFPFAEVVAIATFSGLLIMVMDKGKLPKIKWSLQTWLLILLWIAFALTTLDALRPDQALPELEHMSKVLIMTFLTILVIDDEKKLRYLLLVIALSIGFYGFKGGIFSIVNGGEHMVLGPRGGVIEDNTAIGLAFNMILPMLYYLARSEQQKWLKWALMATFYLTIIATIFTYSRGALLGLVVVLSFIFLKFRFRYILLLTAVLFIASPVLYETLPDTLVDKIATIETYKKDGSAMSRIKAWETSWNLAVDRPLVGGGFNAINDVEIFRLYEPHSAEIDAVIGVHRSGVHSIYFEVLGENGFVAFGLFVCLIFTCISSNRRLQKKFSGDRTSPTYCYASMLEIGLIGYAVSGAFLEHASFDLFYHFVALTIVLKYLTAQRTEENPTSASQEVPHSSFSFRQS